MERLNCFNFFENKQANWEDPLTRAFLLVLRLVPTAHIAFLEIIRRTRKNEEPQIPVLWNMALDSDIQFETQTSKVPDVSNLLSILLTDKHLEEEIEVKNSERYPKYDGVISYQPDWVFIIENKPHHKDVWKEQLSPNLGKDTTTNIDPKAIVIEWKDLLRAIIGIVQNNLVAGTEKAILEDFNNYVLHEFSHLNPYDSFKLCNEQMGLLKFRCFDILIAISSRDLVDTHLGGWNYILFENGAVKQVFLNPYDEKGQPIIRLSLYPGDTINQARIFYEQMDINKILSLHDNSWEIRPNLHFSYSNKELIKANTSLGLEAYLKFWNKKAKTNLKRMSKTETLELLKQLLNIGMGSLKDIDDFHHHFMNTKREFVNMCPGIVLDYDWPIEDAIKLDNKHKFSKEVKQKVEEAFGAWGQSFSI